MTQQIMIPQHRSSAQYSPPRTTAMVGSIVFAMPNIKPPSTHRHVFFFCVYELCHPFYRPWACDHHFYFFPANNLGAFIVLMSHSHTGANAIEGSGLFYSLHQYKTSEAQLYQRQNISLRQLIARKKVRVSVSFSRAASEFFINRCSPRYLCFWLLKRLMQRLLGMYPDLSGHMSCRKGQELKCDGWQF